MENETRIFTIPEHRMGDLENKLAFLNKKARKLGVPEITFKVIESFERSYDEHPLTGVMLVFPLVIRFNRVVIDGIEPKFSGWTFLARIDHEPGGNIICSIPGVELDKRYRDLGPVCEHCRINRYRKSSFVVRHEDGTEKQVGSACLKDFLGHGSPEKIAAFCEGIFEAIRIIGDSEFQFGGCCYHYRIIDVLTLTIGVIRTYGWISAQKSQELGGESTAMTVSGLFFDPTSKASKLIREKIGQITDEEKGFAELALDWIRNRKEQPNDRGDYLYNLKTICAGEAIDSKRFGLVCSLIPTYRREVEHIIERAAKQSVLSSWIGHPDMGRMTLKGVKVVGYNAYENNFGTTHLYRFLANGKDKLTWFASKNQGIEQGEMVDITFSVKKLDEYKGEHITVITRAKMVKSAA